MTTDPVRYLLMSLLCATAFLYSAGAVAASTSPLPDCEINRGACTRNPGADQVVLEIGPKPVKVMEDLTFTVTVKGLKDDQVPRLNLEMVGMFMGKNEVTLVKSGEGRYTGKGVIPRCHSGKKLWSATVELPGHKPAQTSFLFNVTY